MKKNEQAALVGVVVASHGDLAEALIRSAEMIVGEQENVIAVGLDPKDNLDTLHATLDAAIEKVDRGAGAILLIDLFGGTPGNAATLSIGQRKLPAVSGVNLPMLLEVLISRQNMSLEALSTHALASGVTGIVDIAARLRETRFSMKTD